MDNGLNKVMIIGHAKQAPEMRYTPAGVPVSLLQVAVPRPWRDDQGEEHDTQEVFQIVAWEALAERVFQTVTPGVQLYVDGFLQERSWLDKQGNRCSRTELVAADIKVFSPPADHAEENKVHPIV